MDKLKFLGKPAPEFEGEIKWGDDINKIQKQVFDIINACSNTDAHLRGALKEANQMLLTPVSSWNSEQQMSYSDWFTVKYGKEAFRKLNREEFVAFLLRKTLGE
jgi:hypothetical protein